MKEATKKTQVTEQLCRQIELMRRGGANQTQIGKLLDINPCTVSRIEAAGFKYDAYVEQQKARREDEKKRKEKPVKSMTRVEEIKTQTDEPVPGQIEMELTVEKPEMSEQAKMMRFQAAQVDKLIMKLDQIYNMTSMILRAVRNE